MNTQIFRSTVLLVVISLLMSGCAQALPAPSNTPAPTNTPTITPSKTPIPTATIIPSPTPGLAPDVIRQIEEIEGQVSQLRGLSPQRTVKTNVMEKPEIARHLEGVLTKEYTAAEAEQDRILLAALGLIAPDFDLLAFQKDLLKEQVLGFYEFDTDQIYVYKDLKFDMMERVSFAHEFDHLLQNQTYDIPKTLRFSDKDCTNVDHDRCHAIQAFLEGDATLASTSWLMKFATAEEQQTFAKAAQEMKMPVLENAPEYLKQSLNFPYTAGVTFASTLFQKGGWDSVNKAFSQPPSSTAQILHPELYPDQAPKEVAIPDLLPVLGEGWVEIERGVLGEWETMLMLTSGIDPSARLDNALASKAVTGWVGDSYVVYQHPNGPATVFVLKTQWKNVSESVQFLSAVKSHMLKRFDVGDDFDKIARLLGAGITYFSAFTTGDTTFFILAVDKNIAELVSKALEQK